MRYVSYAVGSMSRVLVIAFVLLGCGDKQLESLEAIRDEVCACKTQACIDAALKKVPQDKLKSGRKMQRVAADMMECRAKLDRADRPSTDLDAEAPAEPTSPGSADPASGGTP